MLTLLVSWRRYLRYRKRWCAEDEYMYQVEIFLGLIGVLVFIVGLLIAIKRNGS